MIYSEIIADNDSSVYLKVLQENPYPDVYIKKLNCVNHLRRNLIKKLKKVLKNKTGAQGTECKKAISTNILRIFAKVIEAAKYRVSELNYTFEEKERNLQSDIRNIARHVFGDHSRCAAYFCDGQPKQGEKNMVEELEKLGLFDWIDMENKR